MKVKRASPAVYKAWKVEKFHPLAFNEKQAQTNICFQNKIGITWIVFN